MLQGKSVLITGASQGIGEGLALAFAQEGSHLRLVARSEPKLEAIAQRVRSEHGVSAEILPLDITAPAAVEKIMAFAGDADVLINNAGSIPGGNLWDVDEQLWRSGWELKVFGYINLIRAMYPVMKARREGVILNNIGNGGENFDFNYIAGSTGNAALMAFTRALGGKSLEDLLKSYPLGRAAHVQEVADLFVFLASPRSGYTSGTIVTVDGGITSKRSIT